MCASAFYDANSNPLAEKEHDTSYGLLQLPRLQHPLAVAACSLAWEAW